MSETLEVINVSRGIWVNMNAWLHVLQECKQVAVFLQDSINEHVRFTGKVRQEG